MGDKTMGEKTITLDMEVWARIVAAFEQPWDDMHPPLDNVEADKLARLIREQLGTWLE